MSTLHRLLLSFLLLTALPAHAQFFGDFDGDGFGDGIDNCPWTHNADQRDSSQPPDGRGDACTCGDLDADGRAGLLDAVILARANVALGPGIADPAKCSVAEGSQDCNAADLEALRAFLTDPAAGLSQACLAAVGASNLPVRIAVIGDSITRAFGAECECNFGFSCAFECVQGGAEQPRNSWFDGDEGEIFSVLDRYRVFGPGILSNASAADSGARMRGGSDDFATQADRVLGQSPLPGLVMVLLGGNDLCSRDCASPGSCGSPLFSDAEWREAVRAGLDKLVAGLPADAQVYFGSVPRVQDLYAVGLAKEDAQSDVECEVVWEAFDICRIVTDDGTLSGESQAVRLAAVSERQRRYNEILVEEARAYRENSAGQNPRGVGVFAEYVDEITPSLGNFMWGPESINGGDCFHPSLLGQNQVADWMWQRNPRR